MSDSAPEPGESFIFSARVHNQGAEEAAATTLRYLRSTDRIISTADTQLGTVAVAVLSAREGSAESVEIGAHTQFGTRYYGACVDAVAGESDTANNCSTAVAVRVSMPAGAPDLVVVSPSVTDSEPEAGTVFRLNVTVRNQGTGDAEETVLHYFQSADDQLSRADTEVGADLIEALVASGSSLESTWVRAPSRVGAYYYGACVVAVENESDTSNNCSTSVRVAVQEPPRYPDLVVVSPSVSDASLDTGAEFTLSATVQNQGDAAAAATTLRYYRSTNSRISTDDRQVGTDPVVSLAASGSSGESTTSNAPSNAGSYYYGACVDAVENESDTANNCSTGVRVTVVEPPPDRYGAIARDIEPCDHYASGIGFHPTSEQEAIDTAVNDCIADGGRADYCRYQPRVFHKKCGAVSWRPPYGQYNGLCGILAGEGDTKASAEAAALSNCRDGHPGANCSIVKSACSAD